jgi:hypothetical protein
MLGAFAEFERAMIREHVNAGLARACSSAGLASPEDVEVALRAALGSGVGIRKARLGTSTVRRAA